MVDVGSEPVIRFENADTDLSGEEQTPSMLEVQDDQFTEMVEVVKVAEEPFVRIAHNDESSSVDDYVYSHVIQGYQDQLVDDVVFVGYVQNTVLQ